MQNTTYLLTAVACIVLATIVMSRETKSRDAVVIRPAALDLFTSEAISDIPDRVRSVLCTTSPYIEEMLSTLTNAKSVVAKVESLDVCIEQQQKILEDVIQQTSGSQRPTTVDAKSNADNVSAQIQSLIDFSKDERSEALKELKALLAGFDPLFLFNEIENQINFLVEQANALQNATAQEQQILANAIDDYVEDLAKNTILNLRLLISLIPTVSSVVGTVMSDEHYDLITESNLIALNSLVNVVAPQQFMDNLEQFREGVDALQATIHPSSLSEVDSVHAKESKHKPNALVSTAGPKDAKLQRQRSNPSDSVKLKKSTSLSKRLPADQIQLGGEAFSADLLTVQNVNRAFQEFKKGYQQLATVFNSKDVGDTQDYNKIMSDSVNLLRLATEEPADSYYSVNTIQAILQAGYGDPSKQPIPITSLIGSNNDKKTPILSNDQPQSLFANNQQYAEKELQNRVFGHSGHAPENPVRFLHRNGAHFIGGAVFKQHGVYHVIVFDSLGDPNRTSECVRSILKSRSANAPIQVHQNKGRELSEGQGQYRIFNKKNMPCSLQRDGVNCGPWSVEVISRLDHDRCQAIVSKPKDAMATLARDIAGNHAQQWTIEQSLQRANESRISQYKSLSACCQEKMDLINALGTPRRRPRP
ncbi:MAG: hypothetical protein CMK38_00245 [Porticoccaceae bacterium]|nr:hypothetical protein [Porticoccaceae bacterium]